MPKRPCLDCAQLALSSRCPSCESARQRVRNATRTHYHGTYQADAQRVRDQANADPTTLCRRCHQPARPGDPWQAGHLVDTDPTSPLAAEHRSCNAAAGARLAHT